MSLLIDTDKTPEQSSATVVGSGTEDCFTVIAALETEAASEFPYESPKASIVTSNVDVPTPMP